MRNRCANCMEVYLVHGSTSLYPQSFCGKGCEVESVVLHQPGEDLHSVLSALELQAETPIELMH